MAKLPQSLRVHHHSLPQQSHRLRARFPTLYYQDGCFQTFLSEVHRDYLLIFFFCCDFWLPSTLRCSFVVGIVEIALDMLVCLFCLLYVVVLLRWNEKELCFLVIWSQRCQRSGHCRGRRCKKKKKTLFVFGMHCCHSRFFLTLFVSPLFRRMVKTGEMMVERAGERMRAREADGMTLRMWWKQTQRTNRGR